MPELKVILEGIVLSDWDKKRVLLINAMRPRVARSNEMVMIPPHYPFIGVREDLHQRNDNLESIVVNRLVGDDLTPQVYRCYLLRERHVTFPGTKGQFYLDRTKLPDGTQPDPPHRSALHWAAQIGRLIKEPKMTENAKANLPFPTAVAHVDIPDFALETFSVMDGHVYKFLGTDIEKTYLANQLLARAHTGADAQDIVLDPYHPDEESGVKQEVLTVGADPTTHLIQIMIGNVPVDEVRPSNAAAKDRPRSDDCGQPLFHFELLYDAFDLGDSITFPVPVCLDDDHLDDVHKGSGGYCGPPGGTGG